MRNTSAYLLGLICLLLVHSCAQPGQLTGGEKDVKAPVPVYRKSSLQPASLNVKPSRIEIVFDEYVSISNPSSSITITPNTLKASSRIVGKSLVMDLEGEYLENTTYTIGLNRAVKDITEGNDSLMFFVFSTGNEIDKGKADFIVQDAFNNRPVKDYVVALFTEDIHKDSVNRPVYMGQTDASGRISFSYLKEQSYYVYAFEDVNKNGALDYGEAGGTLKEAYQVSDSVTVTPALLVNEQVKKFKISEDIMSPGIWSITFSQPIDTSLLQLENSKLVFTDWNEEQDSVAYYFDGLEKLEELRAVFLDKEKGDTLKRKYFPDLKVKLNARVNTKKDVLHYLEDFQWVFNDVIQGLDTSKILLDSGQVVPNFQGKGTNTLGIDWEDIKHADSLHLRLLPGSIQFANFEMTDTLSCYITAQKATDVGTILVKADSVFPQGYIELVKEGKTIGQQVVDSSLTVVKFENLQAGKYQFRFIYDVDNNEAWSPGNIYLKTAPERTVWFDEPTNLRANWEVETSLQFD
ncbi:Ig-like domain-containing protein [Lishizhenia tianjinensis]|uniref:Ig-like domain-containing protein n=1 Tax=Lishizhenia tianjinensis TaxID=477690 RepID=A0A1I7BAQ1_9FLAO|nr:Ig-like domain-containing protein [Lishizhenia tianjinensis]SFT84214.1 Ig-like domain-containing protein [Lishizhenia tianjinensis]